jgi:hypothetical protein
MPKYKVRFEFSMPCQMRGWTIEAPDAEKALEIAEACIDENGLLDVDAFTDADGDIGVGGWDHCGDGYDYSVTKDDIEEDDG